MLQRESGSEIKSYLWIRFISGETTKIIYSFDGKGGEVYNVGSIFRFANVGRTKKKKYLITHQRCKKI